MSFQESSFPKKPVLPLLLRILPEEASRRILILNALLGKLQTRDGDRRQQRFAECLEAGFADEGEFLTWIRTSFSFTTAFARRIDDARRQADQQLRQGLWIASWTGGGPPGQGGLPCPRVLFGRGELSGEVPWAAVFNSRKPRLVSGDEEWLRALREILPIFTSHGIGLAASSGVLTYELVASFAEHVGSPILFIHPFPVGQQSYSKETSSPLKMRSSDLVLSCMSSGMRCPKPQSMMCRDRLLAFASDIHCVLEIRSKGNLSALLEAQQFQDPRRQIILRPRRSSRRNEGNASLLTKFPQYAKDFSLEEFDCPASLEPQTDSPPSDPPSTSSISWRDYLYHYTRSCPGPWPGESRRDYLLTLLNKGRACGNTALDALIRILSEGVVRAGSKLVRGEAGVVSLTSRPPTELESLRFWNPALIRWTFEPYGLAISRKVLRRLGVKPAIYASDADYSRLEQRDRFRFQRHEPPRCSWKHEKEWRLKEDLHIRSVHVSDVFVFVPNPEDAEILNGRFPSHLQVIVLSELSHRF